MKNALRWPSSPPTAGGFSAYRCARSARTPYINDARSLALVLLGGYTGREVEGHDWEYLLTQMNLLNQDVYIAHYTLLAARWLMALSLLWAAAELVRQVRALRRGAEALPSA